MAMLHCSFWHLELQFLGNPQPMLIPVGYHQTIECPTTLFLTELLNLRRTIAPEHVEFGVWPFLQHFPKLDKEFCAVKL